MMRATALRPLSGLVLLAAVACSGDAPTTPPVGNTLTLLSITPAPGTKLAPGSNVTFNGNLLFVLNSAGSAEVVLIFEDQNNRILNPASQPTSVVPGGQGELNLPGQFAIPSTGVSQLQVIYTLNPNANAAVPTTASATYPVGP
jgi:hypothetical protein